MLRGASSGTKHTSASGQRLRRLKQEIQRKPRQFTIRNRRRTEKYRATRRLRIALHHAVHESTLFAESSQSIKPNVDCRMFRGRHRRRIRTAFETSHWQPPDLSAKVSSGRVVGPPAVCSLCRARFDVSGSTRVQGRTLRDNRSIVFIAFSSDNSIGYCLFETQKIGR